jgi:cell division protein FtsL
MAAVAERPEGAVRAGPPAAPAPEARSRPDRRRRQPRVASGVVWIAVVGVLLAGVVAMNVAVLQLNLRLDDLARDRAKLRADNAQLASQLSSAAGAAQIEGLARTRLGMVPAQSSETTYLSLDGR